MRFRLIEWLAESPNRKVKAERKGAIARTLNVSTRQVERMLNQYKADRLRETAGTERVDKGHHRIDIYWQDYSSSHWGEVRGVGVPPPRRGFAPAPPVLH